LIKINLLKSYNLADSDVLKEMEDLKHVKAEVLKRIALIILGPLALFVYEYINIPELIASRTSTQNQLAQLVEFNQKKEAMAKEITKYEEDKKRLHRQTRFLERVSRERLYPVEFLNKIVEVIPVGVWLDSLSIIGKRIEIKGESDKESVVSEFEAKLAGFNILKNVKLLGIDIKSSGGSKNNINTRIFTINAEFVTEQVVDHGSEVVTQ